MIFDCQDFLYMSLLTLYFRFIDSFLNKKPSSLYFCLFFHTSSFVTESIFDFRGCFESFVQASTQISVNLDTLRSAA